jgi:hypothetical protein
VTLVSIAVEEGLDTSKWIEVEWRMHLGGGGLGKSTAQGADGPLDVARVGRRLRPLAPLHSRWD